MKKNLVVMVLSAFLLCISAVPAHAVKPNERAPKALGFAAMVCLMVQTEWTVLSKIDRGVGFWEAMSDPRLWKGAAAFGLAAGALSYYVMGYYIPQAKYDYAVRVKNDLEKHPLYVCRKKSDFEMRCAIREYARSATHQGRGLPFVEAMIVLYHQQSTLKNAQTCLIEAVSDMPGDSAFEEQCAKLASEIGDLVSELENHMARIMSNAKWAREI